MALGLHGTPTTIALAQRRDRRRRACAPAAVGIRGDFQCVLRHRQGGRSRAGADNAYSPNREHADWLAEDFGLDVTYYDPMIGAGIADLIRSNTKLIWLEAPGSVTMEVQDVPVIAAVARARGIVSAIDNTYSAGLAFKPFEHGVDISVQALTKCQSGGSEVLMGATITRDAGLHRKLKRARMRLSISVSADDASLVLRSLPSMKTRYEAHDRSAFAPATWLKGVRKCRRCCIRRWRTVLATPSMSVISTAARAVYFRSSSTSVTPPCRSMRSSRRLELFSIGWSWGGSHSLAMPYNVRSMRTASQWPHEGVLVRLVRLVRFDIGLEAEADLRADLEAALAKAFA